jgi:hypothetical protein
LREEVFCPHNLFKLSNLSNSKPYLMKNLRNLLFLFAAVAVLASCNKKKDTLSGVVTDAAGTALEGVTVTVLNVDGTEGGTATTDANGEYTVDQVEENETVEFALTGYLTASGTVPAGNRPEVDATMEADVFNTTYFGTANNSVNTAADIFTTGTIQPSITDFGTLGTISDAFFTTTTYKGAVAPTGTAWYDGWSFYSNLVSGTTTSAAITVASTLDTITDAEMSAITADTIWWNNTTTYILDGFVFVSSGKVLMIEEGTIIQGMAGTGADASALIVARGGKIHAEGTAANPIIFTYEGDNGGTEATQRGLWGGLIILGNASLNSTPGETQIEGIPTSEARGLYGGSADNDNSGSLRYVSIRHGGSNIGADNEINGLTLGGVGSGTTIEYVEVIANKDDGIEWFGGTVNAKYLISAFCADDALDYDEGYRGKNQFVIVHQSADDADRGGEHDGGTSPEDGTPYATPWFVNVTSVGNADSRAITFRDNAGGYYYNSIFTGYGRGVDIEDLVGQTQDSYKQFQDGNLELVGNIFHNIAAGTTGSDLFKTSN